MRFKINTPSLRGVWTQANLLRPRLGALLVSAAVLAPGHAALSAGATGWAVDRNGHFDVHGTPSTLSPDDVAKLPSSSSAASSDGVARRLASEVR